MPQSCVRVFVHAVWATWERQPLVGEAVREPLYRYIQGACRELGCEVLALGGMPDHVHLLVALPTNVPLGQLMKAVKGGSSRYASQCLLSGEWFQWQRGYGAFGVCPDHLERAVAYIRDQERHHTTETLWPSAETCGW